MMNILKVEVELESISPLKMDRWHGLPDPKTEEGYKKQAVEKVYRDEKGNLAIPANAIKACCRYASSELGKKMESKKNRQAIAAGLFIEPEMVSIGKKNYDVMASDVVTRKGTGDKVTRVVSFRPQVDAWKCKFVATIIGIEKQFLLQALELGGFKYGLLSHRPEFGRFVVKSFSEVKNDGKKSVGRKKK